MPYCEIIGRTYEIIGRSNEVSRTNDITKTHVQENASYVRETMSRQNNKSYERHITPYTLLLGLCLYDDLLFHMYDNLLISTNRSLFYDLLSVMYNLLSLRRYYDFLSCNSDVLSHTYDLLSLTCGLVSRSYDLVSRNYEYVVHVPLRCCHFKTYYLFVTTNYLVSTI